MQALTKRRDVWLILLVALVPAVFFLLLRLLHSPEPKQVRLNRALRAAIDRRDAAAAGRLLREGADPNYGVEDLGGKTVLMLASLYDDTATVKTLLTGGADPNIQSRIGETALIEATTNISGIKSDGDRVETVTALLDAGADPDVKDHGGWAPVIWAIGSKRPRILRTLLKRGADPNTHDREGDTALTYAVSSGNTAYVKPLLEAGANPNCRGNGTKTVLIYAKQHGYTEIARLLRQAGARE